MWFASPVHVTVYVFASLTLVLVDGVHPEYAVYDCILLPVQFCGVLHVILDSPFATLTVNVCGVGAK